MDKRSIQEAISQEYERFGKFVKGMVQPGSSRISDELFNLINTDGGVQEGRIVQFLRSRGGLTSISQEDVMELEDLIDQAWRKGRVARGLKDDIGDKSFLKEDATRLLRTLGKLNEQLSDIIRHS